MLTLFVSKIGNWTGWMVSSPALHLLVPVPPRWFNAEICQQISLTLVLLSPQSGQTVLEVWGGYR